MRAGGGLNGIGSKQVYQITTGGKIVNIWPSTMECGRNGFSQSCICGCCNGKLKTYKGYKWSYKDEN